MSKTELREKLHQDDWDRHWSGLNDVTELNPAQRYRHQLLLQLVRRQLAAQASVRTVIDFGSGQGDLAQLIAPVVGDRLLVGLELSRVGVEIASAKTPQAIFHQIDLVTNSPQHPELRGLGDLCVCSEVLEHLDDPGAFLRNARQYMAPDGILIVTVPSGPMNAFEKSIGHRQHFQPDTIARLVTSAGLRVLKVQRAGFPFFNLYKIAGYLMGNRIREGVDKSEGGDGPSSIMMLALNVFDLLFRFNLQNTPFGWQLVLIAKNKPT